MLFQQKKIQTLLGKINVHMTGSGPAMVCWPSLMMSGLMWEGQAKYFGDSYQMILIDSPGHGESELLDKVFTMEDCAKCLQEILDALNINECVLLGNSWGGMMGGVFAALYPERTRAAVLMNCTASIASEKQKSEYAVSVSLLRDLDEYPDSLVELSVKAFAGETTENTKPVVVEYIKSIVKRVDPKSVSWAIESVVPMREDQHALLQTIQTPVFVVTGKEDRTFSVDETKAMADSIPNAIFKVLPRVGHLAALEAPEIVNKEIDSFLKSIT
ncbi:MAG: alpha/beta hydrolase [Cellvibrionaceae bacterium]